MTTGFTGTIYASGPSLFDDIEKYPRTDYSISINTSIFYYIPKGNYYYLSLDMPKFLPDRIPVDAIVLLAQNQKPLENKLPYTMNYIFKREKVMEKNDFPELVNLSQTIWTAMHFLICNGCDKIYGAGVCLRPGDNGEFYFQGPAHAPAPWDVIQNIKNTWKNYVKDNLDRIGVQFISEALNNG